MFASFQRARALWQFADAKCEDIRGQGFGFRVAFSFELSRCCPIWAEYPVLLDLSRYGAGEKLWEALR